MSGKNTTKNFMNFIISITYEYIKKALIGTGRALGFLGKIIVSNWLQMGVHSKMGNYRFLKSENFHKAYCLTDKITCLKNHVK